MTNADEKFGPRRVRLLRNTAFLFLLVVIAQFWLGMTINLEVNLPVQTMQFYEVFPYYAHLSIYVMLHMMVGVLLFLFSLMYLAISMRTGIKAIMVTALISVIAVIGAGLNGIFFLSSGQFFGWSIGMAMSAISSIVAFSFSLYYLGMHSSELSGKREFV